MALNWYEFKGNYSAWYEQMEFAIRMTYVLTPEYEHEAGHWGASLTTKYKKEYSAEVQFISRASEPWWCPLIHSVTLSEAKEACEKWIADGGYENAIAQILEKELDK